MIVGLLALFTVLFGPGAIDLFFMPDMDKGVKEYVIEKDRKKEILADIKAAEKFIKGYNKQRKSDFGQFQDMNKSRATSEADFTTFFSDIQLARESMQSELIDQRISVCNKVEPAEWDSIVVYSTTSFDKKMAKAQKKAEKKSGKSSKEPFDKTRTTVLETVASKEMQQSIINDLDALATNIEDLLIGLNAISANEKPIIARRDASKDEFLEMANESNDVRNLVYEGLVGFHMTVKENTTTDEWDKVMKAFNKELNMTNH